MNLSPQRLKRLQRSLELALNQEWPQLDATRAQLQQFTTHPIPKTHPGLPAIATVATDGGENRLNLEPIRVQVVRVADSAGTIYVEEFIAQSLAPDEIIRFFFQSNPLLQEFRAELKLEWSDLLPRSDYQRGNLLSMMRELMEWAALLKLANSSPPRLLIRDGLLRSVLLTSEVFNRLIRRFDELTAQHDHLLVGVAKRSRVLSYLSVALGLNQTFRSGEPAYLFVPEEIERKASPSQYRWIDGRSMGRLHIARLDRGDSVPLLPVDIALWQHDRAEDALAVLADSARGSFPVRGYPRALIEAHEHAQLGGLEIGMLENLLLEQVRHRDPAVARQARELMLLGRQLTEELE